MLQALLRFLFQVEEQSTEAIVFLDDEAVVTEVIRQSAVWRVSYKASYWTARSRKLVSLMPGDSVAVIGRQNIELIIEPIALLIPQAEPLILSNPSTLEVSTKIDHNGQKRCLT